MQEVEATSMDEFLQWIQSIIVKGRLSFLIHKNEFDKFSQLQLNQAIGKSQNFLASGLVQLREEMLSYERVSGTNQENSRKGLERFFQIFTEYQTNLSHGLTNLAVQLKPIKNVGDDCHQNITTIYVLLQQVDSKIKLGLSQSLEEIKQIRSNLASVQHTYPYKGILDAINNAQRKVESMADKYEGRNPPEF